MQLVVFGASGKVGRLVVAEGLARGHHIRAFTHSKNSLDNESALSHPENLTILQGDIHDKQHVAEAIDGCDAVISTLGSWGTKSKDIVTAGITNIIPAMQQHGIDRIVTLTGTEAFDTPDRPGLLQRLSHLAALTIARKILLDGEQHIRLLRDSHLDWTVLRAPVMTDGPDIFYRLTLQSMPPWQTIPRKAVSKAILDQIDGPSYGQSAPFVYRQKSRF